MLMYKALFRINISKSLRKKKKKQYLYLNLLKFLSRPMDMDPFGRQEMDPRHDRKMIVLYLITINDTLYYL